MNSETAGTLHKPPQMKGLGFWALRFAQISVLVFVILVAAALIKGGTVASAWLESAFWAVISASTFTVTRYYKARKGEACALCQDIVDE
jgi:hypothetical protein